MIRLPGTVITYLQYHAPKGSFIGHWLDGNGEHNVIILYKKDGAYRFDISGFPNEVGHWGHQLTGNSCDLDEMKLHLRQEGWCASAEVKEKVRTIIERLEQGLDIEDILTAIRRSIDPKEDFAFLGPVRPVPQPQFTDEAHQRRISALVQALDDEDSDKAGTAVEQLASLGITEDSGPLFARNALLKLRKRQQREAVPPQAASPQAASPQAASPQAASPQAASAPPESSPLVAPPPPPRPGRPPRFLPPIPSRKPARVVLAYLLMSLGAPALGTLLGIIYGEALSVGKPDYLWSVAIACAIWGFFIIVVKLCRFDRVGPVFAYAVLTAGGVLVWGHYVNYDWNAKAGLYQAVQKGIGPRGEWIVGTRRYRAITPKERETFPEEWKKLDRDELYVRYLREVLQESDAGGFLDHLRARAKIGIVSAPTRRFAASYRSGFWMWWAWSVHAVILFLGSLLSAAAALMQRGNKER